MVLWGHGLKGLSAEQPWDPPLGPQPLARSEPDWVPGMGMGAEELHSYQCSRWQSERRCDEAQPEK